MDNSNLWVLGGAFYNWLGGALGSRWADGLTPFFGTCYWAV